MLAQAHQPVHFKPQAFEAIIRQRACYLRFVDVVFGAVPG